MFTQSQNKAFSSLVSYIFIYICICFSLPLLSQVNISGQIWEDTNANGNVDMGELGIDGVPVFLLKCNGQIIQSILTSNGGDYAFTNVSPDLYKIYVDKTNFPIHVFTSINLPNGNAANSQGNTHCFDAMVGTNGYILNAGITLLPFVGDYVWEDLNGNGLQDIGEPGIGNVQVFLHKSSDNSIIQSTTSDANGAYRFDNVFPDDYYVRFDAMSDYIPTLNINTTSNSDITGFHGPLTTNSFNVQVISPLSNYRDIDGGFYRCANICGTMYSDTNFDDLFSSSEHGINGFKVKLWKVNGINNVALISEQFTSSKPGSPSDDGYYNFCVPPGNYYLEVVVPENSFMIPGIPGVGNDPSMYNHIDHFNGTNTTGTINITSGNHHCDINNGFYCYGSIFVRVWLDINNNGALDQNEELLDSVPVTLYNMEFEQISQLTSDENGICLFEKIKNGDYFIHLDIDPELSFTIAHFVDDNFDNDIDNTFGAGTSSKISVTECSRIDNLGAGLAMIALPVVWEKISAVKQEKGNIISWSISSLKNTSQFQVLKNDGISKVWNSIGSVNINRNGNTDYFFEDINSKDLQKVFYKVVAIDYDGSRSLSTVVGVTQDYKQNELTLSPIPVYDNLTISIGNSLEKSNMISSIQIYDMFGKVIKSIETENDKSIYLDVTDMKSGMYMVVLLESNKIVGRKSFVVQR